MFSVEQCLLKNLVDTLQRLKTGKTFGFFSVLCMHAVLVRKACLMLIVEAL